MLAAQTTWPTVFSSKVAGFQAPPGGWLWAPLNTKDFISSQLDADRMDYLLRDSRAAGPRYGEFDLAWLLHSLRIGKVRVRGQQDAVSRLCFDSRKATHVVEEYIQAREFMYIQVYVHKTLNP